MGGRPHLETNICFLPGELKARWSSPHLRRSVFVVARCVIFPWVKWMPGKEAELPSKRIVCLGRNSSIKDYGRPLRCRSGRKELGESAKQHITAGYYADGVPQAEEDEGSYRKFYREPNLQNVWTIRREPQITPSKRFYPNLVPPLQESRARE